MGRRSIAPEKLLRALLLQVFYTVRSERLLMEELNYNLLSMDDPVWDASTFSKNRDSLLKKKVAKRFFQEALKQARERDLLSDEHFTVDGTLIEAWASLKSFQRKEQEKQENGDEEKDRGNANVNFRGEKRSNQTHDPDAKLARKGRWKGAQIELQREPIGGKP
jgi:hypothetical protein